MLVTEFDRLGDAGNRHLEWDLANGPVDGITLSEVEIVSDRHGDVSEEAPFVGWCEEKWPAASPSRKQQALER
jgi:hypothetical protein